VADKPNEQAADNTFTTSASIFFLSDVVRSGYYTDAVTNADFFGCRIWCGVGSVAERMQINVVG
jgi:hypothetical protein